MRTAACSAIVFLEVACGGHSAGSPDALLHPDGAMDASGSGTQAVAFAAAEYYSCAIDDAGTLSCWGDNQLGELGIATTTGVDMPTVVGPTGVWATVAANAGVTCAIRVDGTLWCWGANYIAPPSRESSPVQIGSDIDWAAVSVGGDHACALKSNRSVWCWGYNYDGQLGDGTMLDSPTPVVVESSTAPSEWQTVSAGAKQDRTG